MKRYNPLLALAVLIFAAGFSLALAGITDNPDGTDPLGVYAPANFKPYSVILDDGTPFLKLPQTGPAPGVQIGMNAVACANQTNTLTACYSCAERLFRYGHGNVVLFMAMRDNCELVDEFR